MTTTRQILRRGISDLLGDFIRDPDGSVPTCSSQGGASGATAVDVLLTYYEDNYFNDWYFVLPSGPSGSGSYEVTRVADFTQSGGSLELEPNATAQIANAQPYELHRYDPSLKHTALNRGAMQASRTLYLPVTDETLIVDNLLTGSSLDNSNALPTGWTAIGSPTHTVASPNASTTHRIHGASSVSIVATGATEGIEQNIIGTLDFDQMKGATLFIRAWIRCDTANAARVRVTADGSTFTNGGWHSGSNLWEGPGTHHISFTIPSGLTELTISCEVTDGNTAYFDLVTAWVDPIDRYTVPTSIIHGPYKVLMQMDELQPEGRYLPIGRNIRPRSGRILRLLGRGVLTAVTSETGKMEISDPDTELLYAYALRYMVMALRGSAGSYEAERLTADLAMWSNLADLLEATPGMSNGPMGTDFPDGYWHTENDGETKLLMLVR